MDRRVTLSALLLLAATALQANETAVTMYRIDPSGLAEVIGEIRTESTPWGVLFTPRLSGLKPGLHGFHLHEHPDCSPGVENGTRKAGLAAGGHFDPENTGRHAGPYGTGHLGDLPALYVDEEGQATHPVLAPRLKVEDLPGHALVIHAGGDNYADEPEPLGGGGARVACGVIGSYAAL